MSLKRILGTMLASRMAGRGKRGGALGTAAMLGGRGRRRSSSTGGKMGIAALGYMAYRAYQDHQSKSASGAGGAQAAGGSATGASTSGGSGSGGSGGGGIAGMVQDVLDKVMGGQSSSGQSSAGQPASGQSSAGQSSSGQSASGQSPAGKSPAGRADGAGPEPLREEELQEEARAAEELSDDTALLLIRAMITAAYADGALSMEERQRIVDAIDEAGGDAEDRAVMEREIANPKPLDELLAEVDDEETAEEFYMASRAAIDGDTDEHRAYLSDLRQRLGLSEAQAAEVEEMTV